MLYVLKWFHLLFSIQPSFFFFFLMVKPYQQQVIEKEDLSLKLRQFLFVRFVGIRHLKQATAAHQTSVGHGKDLDKVKEMAMTASAEQRTGCSKIIHDIRERRLQK